MDNISDNKKKTRRIKRNFTKTKRNLKKKNILNTNLNTISELTPDVEDNENDSFFRKLFSWF